MKRYLPALSLLVLVSAFMTSCIKPTKDLAQMRLENAERDKEQIFRNAVLPQDPMYLEDFVALGLMQNFDVIMRQKQIRVQKESENAEFLSLIPTLTLGGEASERSNLNVISSANVATGVPVANNTDTYSSPKWTRRYNLAAAWSLLDFGLSYYRLRQQENRVRIAEQEYERLKQNLILDISDAYWKAIVAQKATDGALKIISLAESRQVDLEKQMKRQTVPEIEGLENQKRLIEMQIKLANYKRELQKSKANLSALLGLPPLTDYALADVDLKPIEVDIWDIRKLEDEAVANRPELFIQDCNEVIASDDVRSAFLRMFPNVSLFGGSDHDENPFLRNNNWFSAGLRLSWNFLSIPKSMFERKSAEAQQDVVRNTRLQLSIAIMTAVNIAYLDLHDAVSQHQLAVDLSSVKARMLDAGKKGQKQGEFDDADILGLEAESLFAEIYKSTTYAEVKVALERLANSVGQPLLFSEIRLPAYMYTDNDTSNARTYEKIYISAVEVEKESVSTSSSTVSEETYMSISAGEEGTVNPSSTISEKAYISALEEEKGGSTTPPSSNDGGGNYDKASHASVTDWEVDPSQNIPENVKRNADTSWGVACTPLTKDDNLEDDGDLESSPGALQD